MSTFEQGIDAAEADIRQPDFSVLASICTFDGDPAESPFQYGYLYALMSAHMKWGVAA